MVCKRVKWYSHLNGTHLHGTHSAQLLEAHVYAANLDEVLYPVGA